MPKLIIGKRKKDDDAKDEDEILAMATPAKKERSAPSSPPIAGPSTSGFVPPAAEMISKSATPAPVPSLKLTLGKNKTKSSKPTPVPTPPTAPTPEPHREPKPDPSRKKGKEKEVPVPAAVTPPAPAPAPAVTPAHTPAPSAPAKRKSPTAHATPINEKKCKEMLKTLMRLPDAVIFLVPVDPIRDGCPSYVVSLYTQALRLANLMVLGITMRSSIPWTSALFRRKSTSISMLRWKTLLKMLNSSSVIVELSIHLLPIP